MIKKERRLLTEFSPILYFLRVWQKRIGRMLYWYINRTNFAKVQAEKKLSYRYAKHSSKLIRIYSDDPQQMKWQLNKVNNLKIATKKIDNILIKPNEIFSFCKLVGRATEKKGYLEGMVLSSGKAQAGMGGGLCQLSNLLNWLVWHTPLKIIDRSLHSFDPFPDINRVLPFGSGAAIFWNYVDLQILNPTDETFQISVWVDEEALNGEIRCLNKPQFKYHVYEKNHYFTKKNDSWFRSNEIWRQVFQKGDSENPVKLINEEFLVKNFSKVCYEPNINQHTVLEQHG